jgi:hypothetical protein
MGVRRVAALGAVLTLAMSPVASAHAAARTVADNGRHKAAAPIAFYAHDSQGHLDSVVFAHAKATSKALTSAVSPVWWRTFYLTPTSAAGSYVVGVFSGDQTDAVDPPRLFAFNVATKSLTWLTKPLSGLRSPVVDTEKTPEVFYLAGATVREVTTRGTHDHLVYRAPLGWSVSALTVAGTAAPYVAVTRTLTALLSTTSTYVVRLTATPRTVIKAAPGSVTALALSPNTKTLAVSRVRPTGDSVLTLTAERSGGLQRTLPNVGRTSQLSWSGDGRTLAVDPQQWGGWTLVTVATGTGSYPTAMQPYGGGVFVPGATSS